jgi:hypothetical protein
VPGGPLRRDVRCGLEVWQCPISLTGNLATVWISGTRSRVAAYVRRGTRITRPSQIDSGVVVRADKKAKKPYLQIVQYNGTGATTNCSRLAGRYMTLTVDLANGRNHKCMLNDALRYLSFGGP